ncbi:Hypp3816 [Branchiostoma lanceolatum]|uniref:Hypp3816 protein n=1 Tax=Branchiostoma lanceolatum TaxID=7740 RepID=A0A8K0A4S2_BRALA|nr:Hypp3816 [Branchiostoma lanceolatum]
MELLWTTKVFYNQHKTIKFFLVGRAHHGGRPGRAPLVKYLYEETVSPKCCLTSLDIGEILASNSDCWFFEEKENAKFSLENSVVVQAEVHVDAPSSKAKSSPPNESFYQSLYKYHDPRSWEKEDSYSSDEDEPTSTSVAVAEVHHSYDSDVDTHSIRELEENWWARTDVSIQVIQERRRLMKNGCIYWWDPLEITFERSETITLPDRPEESITQKTKKPGAWKKFRRGLGRVRRRLQKMFCGCLMEEEFDPADL